MKQRNPLAVFALPFVTFGIYGIYWLVKTKGELNAKGAKVPTAWILLIPVIGSFIFYWKYSEGVELVTGGKTSMIMAILLLLLLGTIGQAILQDAYNKLSDPMTVGPTGPVDGATVSAPVAPAAPTAPAPTPAAPIEPTAPKPPTASV